MVSKARRSPLDCYPRRRRSGGLGCGLGDPAGRPHAGRGRRGHRRAARRRGHRPDRGGRAPSHRSRPHPGVDGPRTGRHRAAHGRARARGQPQLGGVRARQFRQRADRPADRRSALPAGGLGPAVARSRSLTRGDHHVERRPSRAPGRHRRRRLPHHARSRRGDDLRRGAAHQQAHADLFVGARRLQGQDQQHHALLRHRDRHLGPARALPHHPVRGEGQRDVPGRRRAELGGAGLYRHRLRFLGQGVRHVGGRRAGLARVRRSGAGGNAAGVPVRLSQPQPLARPLFPHHHRLARDPRAPDRARAGRSVDRLRHRAAVACSRCRCSASAW